MQAVTVRAFGDLDAVAVEEHLDPVPSVGEVLVEVQAVPVNFVDLVTMRGEYQFRPELPYIPGKGPAGIVRDVGPGSTDFQVGDRVLAMAEYGGYAQAVIVDSQQVYRLPDELSFDDAAAMSLAYDTAWMALRERARLARGEQVLVLGASGAVGQAAVQLARALGASAVFGSTSRHGREIPGVDGVIGLDRHPIRDSIREQIMELTAGHGVDVVIDPLGSDAFDGAIRALAWRGRLVVVGFAMGRIPLMRVNYVMLKNIEISGLQISDYRKRVPELVRRCFEEVFDFYRTGKLEMRTPSARPLDQWRDAVNDLASRQVDGRLLLHPQE